MPIVRADVCLRNHPSYFFITSERTFCAGGPNLTISGACNGDSGSGLVIFDSVAGRYYLRGVVSRTRGDQQCDQPHYIVFVDVFKYLPWINNNLEIIIQPAQNQSQQAPRPAPSVPVDNIENYNECGLRSTSGRPNLLIAHGKKTLPGQWPWLAAIFTFIYEYEFLCGGTILTTKHVLTAAHCVKTYNNEIISASVLSVALGRYKLMDFNEQESVTMDVERHISHPGYKDTGSADSNLAVLILKSSVEFTAFIRPICLWPLSSDFRRLEQKDGIVVGWGTDELGNLYTEEPRMATMSIVTTDACLLNHAAFVNIISDRTFCAGGQNHSGPCSGDSGSGLVVFDSVTGRYQLRGIVSRGLPHSFCNQTHYVVFVDVFKYLYWIHNQTDFT